jgi:polysaccharide export outer membrane protein
MIDRKSTSGWCVAVGLCLTLVASVFGQQAGAEKRLADKNYRIGSGDVLQIEVAGEPELKRKVKVMEQGTIKLPYIEHELKVEGLTEAQLTALLKQEYLVILKDPQITVYIEEYGARVAAIVGAVNHPKRVPLTRELRVFDLISEGGGLNDKAGTVIHLIHTKPALGEASSSAANQEGIEIIDLRELVRRPELNRVIRDGDVLNVPEAGIFYVSGNVNKPGAFQLKDTIKLSQALAMAGGMAPDSKKKEIRLFRTTDPSRPVQLAQVINWHEIEKDPSKDIILQPYDVILVPEATSTKSARSLLQTFVGGLANAAGLGVIR